jgi:hypothetical protein
VAQLKYLEKTATNKNMIQKEIKSRLNSGNACYRSVHLLSKSVKIRIYKTKISLVVLYGCKTWSDIKRETQIEDV